MVTTREITCKSVLSDSGIEPFDYSVSPYFGCEHACVYCYARFMLRFRTSAQNKEWGDFADAKVNAPSALLHDVKRRPKGVTWLSAVTDPYQSVEKKYELSRKCLEVLLRYKFPIWVQTKSALVMRDTDLLVRFPQKDVGFTILTLDDDLRKKIEPRASPVGERIAALAELSRMGVQTFAFVGPILPTLTDSRDSLGALVREIAAAGTTQILFDRLNLRWGVWPSMKNFLENQFPDVMPKYKDILWGKTTYFEDLKKLIVKICRDAEVKRYEVCY